MRAALAATFLVLSLAACETSRYDDDPLYDAGFSDGCETGTARTPGTPVTRPVRDQASWDASDAYRAGWKAGYSSCAPRGGADIPGSDRDMGGR
ncbi:MAG: hypothetical protein JNK07_03920 [Alphaproteobacteria bacterium]|nr:hypothetical protein [Alphaproteobacteria bacterium]